MVIGSAVALSVFTLGFAVFSGRNDVRVLSIDRPDPGVLQLAVASCNATHDLVVTDLVEGRFALSVEQTSPGDSGADCSDIVEYPIDPTLETFEVEDLVSGDVFEWPPPDIPTPVNIDGTWLMTQVNGEPVEVGVNTQSIPLIDIESGFLSGNFGCNGGGGELFQEGDQLRGVVGGDEEFCGMQDLGASGEFVPTERIFLEMLNSDDGASVRVTDDSLMIWRRGADELIFEMA